MEKYLIGSKLLGLSNKDTDYIVITNENKKVSENGEDIFCLTKEQLLKNLNFNVKNSFVLTGNYQYDRAIIGSEFPIEYHILEHKKDLIELLKRIVNKRLCNFNKRITQGNKCCCKMIYHIAYNLFILENNSPIITQEQKAIIQDIHDIKMPIEYLDELEKRILNL